MTGRAHRIAPVGLAATLVVASLAGAAGAQSRFRYHYPFPVLDSGFDEFDLPWSVAYDPATQRLTSWYHVGDLEQCADYQLPLAFEAYIEGFATELKPGTWLYCYAVSNSRRSEQSVRDVMIEIGDFIFDVEIPSSFDPTLSRTLPTRPGNHWGFELGRAMAWAAVDRSGIPPGAAEQLCFKSHGIPGIVMAYASGDEGAGAMFIGEPPEEVTQHYPVGREGFAQVPTVGPVPAQLYLEPRWILQAMAQMVGRQRWRAEAPELAGALDDMLERLDSGGVEPLREGLQGFLSQIGTMARGELTVALDAHGRLLGDRIASAHRGP